jgi:hypothetical protein
VHACLQVSGTSGGACAFPGSTDPKQCCSCPVQPEPAPTQLVAVDCNIECGGRYADHACGGTITYGTATKFAQLLKGRDAWVVGMQEVSDGIDKTGPYANTKNNYEALLDIIRAETAQDWDVVFWPQGVGGKGSGLAVLWRPLRLRLLRDLGTLEIDRIRDDGYAPGAYYSLRFGGALFVTPDHLHTLGVFTGKIAWGHGTGATPIYVWDAQQGKFRPITASDKAAEAAKVRAWVSQALQPFPRATRLVTTDLNSDDTLGFDSPTYEELAKEYDPGSFKLLTAPAQDPTYAFDMIWWDFDSGPKQAGGFLDGPRRSMDFGSDHRFVWGTLRLR